jgi:hypothetical protein
MVLTVSPRHRRDRRSESDHRSSSGPAGPKSARTSSSPSSLPSSSPSIRGEVYARLERTPFNRGVAGLAILAAGVVALLIVSGTFRGGDPGAPLPEAVQATGQEPIIIGSVPSPSPSPARPSRAGRSTVTASNVLRVPAARRTPRPKPDKTSRPGSGPRPPLWRHDPSQWGPDWWLWNPWPSGGDDNDSDHHGDHDDRDHDGDDGHDGRHSESRTVQSGASYGTGSNWFGGYGVGTGVGFGGFGDGYGAGWYGRR